MELPFAAVQQLCAPLIEFSQHIPSPQRDALATALGLQVGTAPDRFLVGLAVLNLLSEAASERPLLRVIDDAHWLDGASAATLASSASLLAESVALALAAREPTPELGGLPALSLAGLEDADAHVLVLGALHGPIDERVRNRFVAESRGNPLALLELPREPGPTGLAGGFGLPGTAAVPGRIEESFRRRLRALPDDTQLLVLLASAEPVGDPALLWRAADQLGVAAEALDPAVGRDCSMSQVGCEFRFAGALALYHVASPDDRRLVHRALADAMDPRPIPTGARGIALRRPPAGRVGRRRARAVGASSPKRGGRRRRPRSSSAPAS